MNTDIAEELISLAEEDQKLRKEMPLDSTLQEAHWRKIKDFDLATTKRLKTIVDMIGLPTITKVGKKASNSAWLLVQHSPDLNFQKHYLELLKNNRDDITLSNIAYLEDRVLMYEGKPQIYGTQVIRNKETKEYVPYTIADETNVDKRRSECGLQTLTIYLEEMNRNL